MNPRPSYKFGGCGARGVTLLELVFGIFIVGILLGVGIPSYRAYVERARVTAAIGDIGGIHVRIQAYIAANYDPPPNLATIGMDGRVDPWGNAYVYLSFTGLKGKGKMRKD